MAKRKRRGKRVGETYDPTDYAFTRSNYAYPEGLNDLAAVHADVTYGNDVTDSVIFWSGGRIWKLWVQPCCIEQRSDDDAVRFVLQSYTAQVPDDLGVAKRTTKSGRSLRAVGPGRRQPTAEQLASWHDNEADSSQWEDIWEGENSRDLLEQFDEQVNAW
jgi:hypothetical protein